MFINKDHPRANEISIKDSKGNMIPYVISFDTETKEVLRFSSDPNTEQIQVMKDKNGNTQPVYICEIIKDACAVYNDGTKVEN